MGKTSGALKRFVHTRDWRERFGPARLRRVPGGLVIRARVLRQRDWLVRFVAPDPDKAAIRRRLDRLNDSAERGIEWALGELRRDSTSSIDRLIPGCYKGVWALAIAGHENDARSLLERIAPAVAPDGDLPGVPPGPFHYIYRHGYIAIGAAEVGATELFESLSAFVAGAQDPRTGGFWSRPPESPERWIDTSSTSVGGLVQLRRGDVGSAVRSGEFLRRVFRSQPVPNDVFFTTVGEDGRLIADRSLPDQRAVEIASLRRHWSLLGLPALFLAELYRRTGESAHLELAVDYLEFIRSGKAKDRFFVPDAGKIAGAAAGLHGLTHNKRYAHIALSTCASFAAKQRENGRWSWSRTGEGDFIPDLDLTFEYVLWLRLVTGSLGKEVA